MVVRATDRAGSHLFERSRLMSATSDTWYVRFPDGRVVRASSTHVVRQHLGAGQIPFGSRVRRSEGEEWIALEWAEEFADLVESSGQPTKMALPSPRREAAGHAEPAGIVSRLDSQRLRTVGLRGLVEELAAALDNTLSRPKLMVAGTAGVLSGVVVAATASTAPLLPDRWPLAAWAAAALVLLIVWVIANVLLTQMTYIELSRLRPARWLETRTGLTGFALRLLGALLVTAGAAVVAIVLLRWLPQEMVTSKPSERLTSLPEAGAAAVKVVGLVVEMLLWPAIAFTFLLGPVVVVEECSAVRAVRQWWRLVRRHLGLLFLYEAVAFLGGIITLVFAVPLAIAAVGRWGHWGGYDTALGFSLCVLSGLAAAPLVAYLAVAHVFIYLNLRYEVDQRRR
jgi:hypothetical protein